MAFPVLAVPPPYVTGLSAEVVNGEISVGWASQPNADVAYYRVFYSFESILENEGLYDDFEETSGPVNTYIIKNPPPVDKLYIAVIGVSPQEEDINMFVEEVSVSLGGGEDNWDEDDWPEDDWGEEDWPEDDWGNDDNWEDETLPPNDDLSDDVNETDPSEEPESFWDRFLPGEEQGGTQPASVPPPKQPLPQIQSEDSPEDDNTLILKKGKLLLPGNEPPRQQPTSSEPEPASGQEGLQTLSLLSAKASSPTEVFLEFSGPITVEPDRAPEAFSIVDADGNGLAITYMTIEGPNATVTTVEQSKESIYEFRMNEPAYSPDGLPLDLVNRRAFFLAHADSPKATPKSEPAIQNTGPLQGISNFKMGATPVVNGLYYVSARWDVVGDRKEIAYYIVHQTRDGGQTFGDPQVLQPNIGGVELTNVMPGPFGIALSFMHINGMVFQAAFENINLGPGVPPPPQAPAQDTTTPTVAPTGSVVFPGKPSEVTSPPHSDTLNQSGGMAAAASLMIVGGVMGWRAVRRKLAL
ncbi:MAG: hypothetical protein ABIA92_05335 [Patescibacteria group bacterium]